MNSDNPYAWLVKIELPKGLVPRAVWVKSHKWMMPYGAYEFTPNYEVYVKETVEVSKIFPTKVGATRASILAEECGFKVIDIHPLFVKDSTDG